MLYAGKSCDTIFSVLDINKCFHIRNNFLSSLSESAVGSSLDNYNFTSLCTAYSKQFRRFAMLQKVEALQKHMSLDYNIYYSAMCKFVLAGTTFHSLS